MWATLRVKSVAGECRGMGLVDFDVFPRHAGPDCIRHPGPDPGSQRRSRFPFFCRNFEIQKDDIRVVFLAGQIGFLCGV